MSFQSNSSLFIGDLPKFCTERDLEQLFSSFGPIFDVKIKRNNSGKTLSYGFVTLSSEAYASKALEKLDGSLFNGRTLRVRWAMYNARSQNPIHIHQVINSIYVRFSTPRLDQFITEEVLRRLFGRYGTVGDVSIKESSFDPRLNRQSGYAFVHFSTDSSGIKAAFDAVNSIDNQTIDGVTYNVELSKNLLKQFNDKTNSEYSSSEPSLSRTSSFNSSNLNSSFYSTSSSNNTANNPNRYSSFSTNSSFTMQNVSPHQSYNQLPIPNNANLSLLSTPSTVNSTPSISPSNSINILPRTISNSNMNRFEDSRLSHPNYSAFNNPTINSLNSTTNPTSAPYSSYTSNNLSRVDSFNNNLRMLHSNSSQNLMHSNVPTNSPPPPPPGSMNYGTGVNINPTFMRYNSFPTGFAMPPQPQQIPQQPQPHPGIDNNISSPHGSFYFQNNSNYSNQSSLSSHYSPYSSQYQMNTNFPQNIYNTPNPGSTSIPNHTLPARRRSLSNESFDDLEEEKVFSINNADDLHSHLNILPSNNNYNSLQYSSSQVVSPSTSSHSFSPNTSFYSYSGSNNNPNLHSDTASNSVYQSNHPVSSYNQLASGDALMGQYGLESPTSSSNLYQNNISKIYNASSTSTSASSSSSPSTSLVGNTSLEVLNNNLNHSGTSPSTQLSNLFVGKSQNEDSELDIQDLNGLTIKN